MVERVRRKESRPRDPSQLAAAIVREATGQEPEAEEQAPEPELTPEERSAAAKALGRRGGLKGGKARAEKLTPEQRREIAKKAAAKRWSKP